jgi:D-serine deaminase-like pyridoxal phosphate-dependent protein
MKVLPTPCSSCRSAPVRRERRAHGAGARRAGGPTLRPHLKTVKSIPAALRILGGTDRPITVSTLLEAERFAEAGFCDILYAVGIAPGKLDRVLALRRRGVDLMLVTDNVAGAEAIAAASRAAADPIPVLIEIDSDGHRAGVRPGDADLLRAIAAALEGADLRGVMTHAGGSYGESSADGLARAARPPSGTQW